MIKKIVVVLLLPFFVLSCKNNEEKPIVKGNVKETKINAQFAGGREAFKAFLESQLRIPKPAAYFGVNAFVDLEIVFDSSGMVQDVSVEKVEMDADKAPKEALTNGVIPLDKWFAMEASRIIWLSSNKWKPAEQLERTIAQSQLVTIYFETPQYVLNHREELPKYGQLVMEEGKKHEVLFFETGTLLITNKKWKGAQNMLAFATEINASYSDAWFNLGLVYTQLKNPKLACESWMIAAENGDLEAEQLVLNNCKSVIEEVLKEN